MKWYTLNERPVEEKEIGIFISTFKTIDDDGIVRDNTGVDFCYKKGGNLWPVMGGYPIDYNDNYIDYWMPFKEVHDELDLTNLLKSKWQWLR